MRRLILMRHAKSSWDSPTLSDHDRPLNGRGKRSATALGAWLRAQDYAADEALVSDAMRTRQTMDALGLALSPKLVSTLYHASLDALSQTLRGAIGTCVLMIGHNPGIAEFASWLVATAPDHDRFFDYPTGATLVADFDIERWRDVTPASGQVQAFVIPRELTD